MDRNTVKFVVAFTVKTLLSIILFVLMSVISIVKGICGSLYESWTRDHTLEQTEKECKFWCLIKSLSRHGSDLSLDEKNSTLENDKNGTSNNQNDNVTMVDSSLSSLSPSSSSAPPRHVFMRKNARSVSPLLDAVNQLDNSRKNKRRKENVVIEKPTTDIIRIPSHIVSSLIGKHGNHIREIENKSHTRIAILLESDLIRSFGTDCEGNNVDQKKDSSKNNNTDDPLQVDDGETSIISTTLDTVQNPDVTATTDFGANSDHTVCRIKGKLRDISIAQGLIKNYIDENPAPVKITKEIIIPQNCVGFVIGKNARNQKNIQSKTKAKFSVQPAKPILSTLTTIPTTSPEEDNDEWEDFTTTSVSSSLLLKNEGKENGHDTTQELASIIVVKGIKESVEMCENMIMEIVKAHSGHNGNNSRKKRQRGHPNHHRNLDDPNFSSLSSSHATGGNFIMSDSVNKFGRSKKPHHRNNKTQNSSNNKNNNKDNLQQGMTFEEEDWEPVVSNNNNTNTSNDINGNDANNSSDKTINNVDTTTEMKNECAPNISTMQPNNNPINYLTFAHRQEHLPSPNELDGGRITTTANPYQYYPNGRGRYMRTPQNQQQYNQPRFPNNSQGQFTHQQTHYMRNDNFRHSAPRRFELLHNNSYSSNLRFGPRQGNDGGQICPPFMDHYKFLQSNNPYKWIASNNNNNTTTTTNSNNNSTQPQQEQISSPNCSQQSQT